MGSLIPTFNYTPNTTAASNAYVASQSKFSDSLMDPINLLSKLNNEAIAAKEHEEDRAWKLEDRARLKKEQEALDKYFGVISQGEQVKGGVLNTDPLIAESDKYSFTPEEIAKYDAYKGDSAVARAAGDTGLADKIDWQTNLSRVADKIPESGIANEGRVSMYERARDEVAKAGLPVSKEMVAAVDSARLAEQTAKKEKREDIEKQLADLSKQELDMQKYYGNKIGGGSSFVDEDGNTVSLGSKNRSTKDQTKAIIDGTTALSKAVNSLEGLEAQEKKDAAKIATDTFNLIVSRGVDPTAAAKFIGDGLSTKDTGMLFWADKEPKINTDMINQFVDTYKVTEAKLGAGESTSVTRNTEKENYARDLLAATMQGNAAKRAKLQGDLDALNMTSNERMEAGLTELLRKNGVLPEEQLSGQLDSNPKTNSGSKAVSFPGEGKTKADRNNNPGNLTGNDKWKGMVGKDGKFIQFQSYELGSRALAKNLMNGAVGKTIEDYMNKYAPKSENNTKSYINHVTKALGKAPGSVITDADVLPLMKVIAKHEGGKVDEAKLEAGYKLATALNGRGFKEAPSSVKDILSKVKTSEEKGLSSKADTSTKENINSTNRSSVGIPIEEYLNSLNTKDDREPSFTSNINGIMYDITPPKSWETKVNTGLKNKEFGMNSVPKKLYDDHIFELNNFIGAYYANKNMDRINSKKPASVVNAEAEYEKLTGEKADKNRQKLIDDINVNLGGIAPVTGMGLYGNIARVSNNAKGFNEGRKLFNALRREISTKTPDVIYMGGPKDVLTPKELEGLMLQLGKYTDSAGKATKGNADTVKQLKDILNAHTKAGGRL